MNEYGKCMDLWDAWKLIFFHTKSIILCVAFIISGEILSFMWKLIVLCETMHARCDKFHKIRLNILVHGQVNMHEMIKKLWILN